MAEQRSSGPEGGGLHARQKIEVSTDNIDSVILALGRGVRVSGRVITAGGDVHFERLYISLMSREDEFPGGWAIVKRMAVLRLRAFPMVTSRSISTDSRWAGM
jgi:hypothetical protein